MAGVRSNKGEINTDGYYYQLYTLLHCCNRLRKSSHVTNYEIGTAVVGFGALDDVVFTGTLHGGEKFTTAIQVKHSNTKNMIDERYLCQNSRTYLCKYMESFMEIKKTTPLEQLEQLILWTNMPFHESIRGWFEEFVPAATEKDVLGDGNIAELAYERYRIRSSSRQEVIKNCQGQPQKENEKDASRRKNKKDVHEPSEEEWNQFFERLVFYVQVPKIAPLKDNLVKNIGSNFDDLCNLMEKYAAKRNATDNEADTMITSDQINGLFTLVNLRNCMESGPYTKLVFNDLDKLQSEVKELLDNGTSKLLRVKASQDVDCTVARLVTVVVEKCLAAENKRYLTFSYETFVAKWSELQKIVGDPDLVEIGLKCFIISHITDDQLSEIENQLSPLKVIFVGSKLNSSFDDTFDVNGLDDTCKNMIKNRKIKLSECQSATVNEIFSEELFQKENYSMVLGLHKLPKDSILKVTVDEPSLDIHYRSRIVKMNSSNKASAEVELLNQTEFCKVVIHDQPGMGKTTEMVKLSTDFRIKYQDHLVIYLHCKTAVTKWKGSVEDLVCNSVATCSELTKHVVKKIVQLGKVILIMDGYDEVSKKYNSELNLLLMEIAQVKMFRQFIATRPQYKDEINHIFGECGLCRLEPFSEVDQLAYLKKFWNVEKKFDDKEQAMVDKNSRSIIKKFRAMMDGTLLIGIPLQTYMIAVIYQDSISSPNFKVSESQTLGFIYKAFVDLKFKEYIKRNFDPTNAALEDIIDDQRKTFLHGHIEVALRMYENKSQSETDVLWGKIQHYGIVLTHPTATFIHQTYMEYFLALHLLTYSLQVDTEYNIKWYVDNPGSLVCKFMDYLVDHVDPSVKPNPPLFESDNDSSKPPTDYTSPKTARLHPVKMIEFNRDLYDIDPAKVKSLFSGLISHKLVNMIEVIYDSLRIETIIQVQICLDLFCKIHPKGVYFCLRNFKDIDILIPILNIMLKKNPDTFVPYYFTSVSDQEKALELMCHPDYSKLFDWFTGIFVELNDTHRATIKEFIAKRLDRCLKEIVNNENIGMLKKVVTLIKNTWKVEEKREATSRFLTQSKVFFLFTKNIEYDICGSDESITTLMLECVLDLYQWALDQQIPLDKQFFDYLQTASVLDEASGAFDLPFF